MNTEARPRIGIVTISDRASTGVYQDLSGPAIRETLQQFLLSPWDEAYRLIPDDQDTIERTLKALCDDEGCCMVLTTGGTGPGPRDVTPEATGPCVRASWTVSGNACAPCPSSMCPQPSCPARWPGYGAARWW